VHGGRAMGGEAPRSITAMHAFAAIYEGTNGIQAIDLVTRKLPLAGGATVKACIGELKRTSRRSMPLPRRRSAGPAFGSRTRSSRWSARPIGCSAPHNDLDTRWQGPRPILRCSRSRPVARSLRGGALAAMRLEDNGADAAARIAIARFFAEKNVAVAARRPGAHGGRGCRQREPNSERGRTDVENRMTLEDHTLFITGGVARIGLAIALRAARDGANIVIAAKTDTPHPKLPGPSSPRPIEIAKAGGKALAAGRRRARRGGR